MKSSRNILLLSLLSLFCFITEAQDRCSSTIAAYRKQQQNRVHHSRIEGRSFSLTGTDTLIVPVVVHVLYNTPEQNISDEQIKSQIDVLNEDYSATNATLATIPDVWKDTVTDAKIRFVLAQRTPGLNFVNTTGITRTQVSSAAFSINDPAIKSTAAGGIDGWPRDEYLNIWVCNLEGEMLGYATFPGALPEEDGVVIDYQAFGRVGDLKAKYNLGRSASHEIGHWFELLHIWGDSPDCDIDDEVEDTPLQGDANYCCPKYPKFDNCTAGGDGVMFMNYMDYSDDKLMQFFTRGQIFRMDSSINVNRSTLYLSQGDELKNIYSNDVAITEVVQPVIKSELRCLEPAVRIKNLGSTNTNQITIKYNIHERNPKYYTFSGSLAPGMDTIVFLPSIGGDNGLNILEFRIIETDSNAVNNYISRSYFIKDDITNGCQDSDPVIYPNPVTGSSFCVKSNFVKSQMLKIRLVNMIGQMVYQTELLINPGDNISIPLDKPDRGLYFIQLVGEDEARSAAVVIFQTGDNADFICR